MLKKHIQVYFSSVFVFGMFMQMSTFKYVAEFAYLYTK